MTTCQICGRQIKANTGTIAHHGYERPGDGWQTSSCMGAKYLPYELSCDRIPSAIEAIETFITKTGEQLKELTSNPPATLTYMRGYKAYTVEKPTNFDASDRWSSTRPMSYEGAYMDEINKLNRAAKGAKFDLKYLQERLAAWVAPVTA